MLSRCQAASTSQMTSTCQNAIETVTSTNPDGSSNVSFVPTGPTFPGNLQPRDGDKVPAPLALLDRKWYQLFTPAANVPVAKNQIIVDGVYYNVYDVRAPRSPGDISTQSWVSALD